MGNGLDILYMVAQNPQAPDVLEDDLAILSNSTMFSFLLPSPLHLNISIFLFIRNIFFQPKSRIFLILLSHNPGFTLF